MIRSYVIYLLPILIKNMNGKEIENELNNLTRDDIGYGDPEARLQDERKFQLLMHKQIEKHERTNTVISFINLIFAFINILLLILYYRSPL